MSQTSIIAGSLLLAYFIFIIVRGELPCYFQVLGIGTAQGCPIGKIDINGVAQTPAAGNALTGSGSGSSAGSVLGGVAVGIGIAGAIRNTGIFGPNGPFGFGGISNGAACEPGDPYCGLDFSGIPLAP
jgi:hypothetical protein